MAKQRMVSTNFWADPYTLKLNWRGKLALYYALSNVEQQQLVIVEDMALHTGLEASEVSAWLHLFIRQGKVSEEAVGGLAA